MPLVHRLAPRGPLWGRRAHSRIGAVASEGPPALPPIASEALRPLTLRSSVWSPPVARASAATACQRRPESNAEHHSDHELREQRG
eukprot:9684197-Alexandrium_andersonii.AAC.1